MIRRTTPDDVPTLVRLTDDTGVFKPMEIETLQEVMDDYFDGNQEYDHRSYALERDGDVLGYVYYAPAAMTDRTWYLYWIAVRRDRQAKGTGSELLRWVEDDVRDAGGRLLIIETSSLPPYEPTRRFYLKHGYELAAQIRDFYAEGDDLVVFRKRLASG